MLGTHKASCAFGKHARHMQSPAAGMQGTHRMQNMQGTMHDIYTRHEKPTEHAHSVCTTCAVSTHITLNMDTACVQQLHKRTPHETACTDMMRTSMRRTRCVYKHAHFTVTLELAGLQMRDKALMKCAGILRQPSRALSPSSVMQHAMSYHFLAFVALNQGRHCATSALPMTDNLPGL